MPAVPVLKQRDNNVPQAPGRWLAGEIVANFEQTNRFGFNEMPINPQGSFNVSQINNLDITSIPLYASVKCLDAGVVTSGTGDDVSVVADDILVKQFGNYWVNYGARTEVPDSFYHIRVSDKTLEEVDAYLERYNKKLEYQTDQFNPPDNMRRWTTTNVRVSASGNNGFTAQGIADAISEWNTNHPANTVTLVDTDNLNYFQVDGIMPVELYVEWQENTQEIALADFYARRRWYITSAGLTALANNAGIISGPASSVNQYLRDGLLD